MEHFVCTGGCGGISGTPGVCQTESCPHHKHSLESCSCTDGSHDDVKRKAELEELKQTEEGYRNADGV